MSDGKPLTPEEKRAALAKALTDIGPLWTSASMDLGLQIRKKPAGPRTDLEVLRDEVAQLRADRAKDRKELEDIRAEVDRLRSDSGRSARQRWQDDVQQPQPVRGAVTAYPPNKVPSQLAAEANAARLRGLIYGD